MTAIDPATLDPSGYWLAPYASPWTPTASAGTSGSNGTLVTSGTAPTSGTAVNGYAPASYAGTPQALVTNTATGTTLWSLAAGTTIVIAKASAAVAEAADFYDDPLLMGDT